MHHIFKYIEIHYAYKDFNSKWKRILEEDIDKHLRSYIDEYNCFTTIQKFKNPTEQENELQWVPIYFDFDHEENLQFALDDTLKVIEYFCGLGIRKEHIRVWFSGKKGFHITIEPELFGIQAHPELTYQIKLACQYVSHFLKLKTFDSRVYSIKRMWRLPDSIHQSTRLFCIELDHSELTDINQIKKKAKESHGAIYDKVEYEDIREESELVTWWQDFLKQYADIKDLQRKCPHKPITKSEKDPICITDVMTNSIRKPGTRNQACVVLAGYYKDTGCSIEEASEKIYKWAEKIPKELTTLHSGRALQANTKGTLNSVYGDDKYHFACSYIRALGAGTDKPIACDLNNCKTARPEDQEAKILKLKLTQGEILTRICEKNIAEFIQDQFGDFYVVIPFKEHKELWSTSSKGFRERWLAHLYRKRYDTPPGTEALKQARIQIEVVCEKQERKELHNRVAWYEGNLYYDLSNKKWKGVKITKDGWEIVELPMVFRRYKHQKAQIEPVNGDPKILLDFCNINKKDHCLFLTTVASWFIPDIPHPIMVQTGEQGSGKTENCRNLKKLIDPSTIPFTPKPKDIEAGQQIFDHHWFLSLDNVSGIPDWLSDLLCRTVTGEGTAKRSLYTDDEDFIRSYRRCVAINGIGVTLWRPDLLDRCILFEIPLLTILKSEQEIAQKFKEVLSLVLGGFLTAISKALNHIDEPTPHDFRMADFARWGVALAGPLGFTREQFINDYRMAIKQKWEDAAETSILGQEIVSLFKRTPGQWQGTARALFDDLARDEKIFKLMPKSPQSLSRELRRLAPALRRIGFEVIFDATTSPKTILLTERTK